MKCLLLCTNSQAWGPIEDWQGGHHSWPPQEGTGYHCSIFFYPMWVPSVGPLPGKSHNHTCSLNRLLIMCFGGTLVKWGTNRANDCGPFLYMPLSAAEQVSGGSIDVKLYWNKVSVYSTTLDLCQILPEVSKLTCPVQTGPQSVMVVETIPGFLPSVSVLLCISYGRHCQYNTGLIVYSWFIFSGICLFVLSFLKHIQDTAAWGLIFANHFA